MEQSELQVVADITAEEIGLDIRPKIEVKDVRRGRARDKTNKITIPFWAVEREREYAIYYAVHEVCHFKAGMRHDKELRKLEQSALARWGIRILYARVYPKFLCDLSGKRICGALGNKLDIQLKV